jgi:SRSO17 transposase
VGVARQYCRMLGKLDNCQVAVSVSLACDQCSVPVAWQLFLPEDWAANPVRRVQAGVPEELRFATKTQIALTQLRTLLAEGAPHHCVLTDDGYGMVTAFRQALSDMGLACAVGVTSAVVVWPPGVEPLPPKPYSGTGRPPVMPQCTARLQPMSVKALALSLPARAFQTIGWREGTIEPLCGRFAALRVRHAGGNAGRARLRPLQWSLIEWPEGDAEPSKYVLSTLPEDTPMTLQPECCSEAIAAAWVPGFRGDELAFANGFLQEIAHATYHRTKLIEIDTRRRRGRGLRGGRVGAVRGRALHRRCRLQLPGGGREGDVAKRRWAQVLPAVAAA